MYINFDINHSYKLVKLTSKTYIIQIMWCGLTVRNFFIYNRTKRKIAYSVDSSLSNLAVMKFVSLNDSQI